jgi:hypothetical protein
MTAIVFNLKRLVKLTLAGGTALQPAQAGKGFLKKAADL